MRILFLTNYYPPSRFGWGYMQLCEEVADGLHAKGHEVSVLTSIYCDGAEIKWPYSVHRLLHLEPDWDHDAYAPRQFFIGRRQREQAAVQHVRQSISQFKPDIVFLWHMVGIPRLALQEVQKLMGDQAAFYLADYQPEISDEYMAYWQGAPVHGLSRLFKGPMSTIALNRLEKEGKPIALDFNHVACVSGYVRDRLVRQKLISDQSVVIHNGVDLDHFSRETFKQSRQREQPIRCLVAGRLVKEKGIHTVVHAFGLLDAETRQGVHLTILGSGDPDYYTMLQDKVRQYNLEKTITFQEPIPRDQMPEMLGKHDLLIFSSEYDEPLARAMQEAMALGLLVIGTTTGGSGELLEDGVTGLVYEAGNANQLSTQIQKILKDETLFEQLAQSGYEVVLKSFSIDMTIERCEQFLQSIVNQLEHSFS